MKPFIFEISETDPARIYSALHALPYSLWLDSADTAHEAGRHSFIAALPVETIEARGGEITITNKDQQTILRGREPFALLRERLDAWKISGNAAEGLPPFQGGMAGFFGYDMGRYIEDLPPPRESNSDIPDMALGIYDQVIAFDHEQGKAWAIVHAPQEEEAERKHRHLMHMIKAGAGFIERDNPPVDFTPCEQADGYKQKIGRVIEYIRAGDIFQANLAQRFEAQLPEGFDSFSHYMKMRRENPAPFASYMNLGNIRISSASPERFITVHDGRAETRPIKGTRPRLRDAQADKAQREELLTSEKDRAENIMIVDLMRNDLSRVCTQESVEAEDVCRLESFTGLHHLVSTVTGALQKGRDDFDLMRACFPGGSITGAPKIRAMEIIAELEPAARGPYCGSMAYIGFDGTMDSSILIRTLVYEGRTVYLQSGGGITADSDAEAEYQETLTKADALLRSFEATREEEADTAG